MDGPSMAPSALMSNFRAAGRQMLEAFLLLIGIVPTDDLREELDGQLGRLRGVLDLHAAETGT